MPTLGDPNFAGTVVLITEHSDEGAMGLVLNRPLGVTVASAVPILTEFVTDDASVHFGGPVSAGTSPASLASPLESAWIVPSSTSTSA